jgi:hypothetical protein
LWGQRRILSEKTAKSAIRRIKIQEKVENLEHIFFLLFIKKWYLRVVTRPLFAFLTPHFFGPIASEML